MKIREFITEKDERLVKPRDPSHKILSAKRSSGAGGVHKDKKREEKLGKFKHKNKELSIDEVSTDLLKTFLSAMGKKHPSALTSHPNINDVKRRKSVDLALDKIYPKSALKNVKVPAKDVAEDDNGNTKCWSGYRKVGLKKKGGKMVNDCRPIKNR